MVEYGRITKENFTKYSLDTFIRHQQVQEVWRFIDGQWKLVPCRFTEDWSIDRRREVAEEILEGVENQGYAYAAWEKNRVVGYSYISPEPLGSAGQYMELRLFHISEPFRGMGIGRRLFEMAAEEAKRNGARKLYISAHSSRESQAAYRKLGCVHAQEVVEVIAQAEPFDVQMEYCL